MDAFVPTSTSTPSIVQYKQTGNATATFDAAPSPGNKIIVLCGVQESYTDIPLNTGGLTTIDTMKEARSSPHQGGMRLGYRDVVAGDPAGPYGIGTIGSNKQTTIIEVEGLPAGGPLNNVSETAQTGTGVSKSITPAGGVPAWLVGGFGSVLYPPFGGTPTFTPNASSTAVGSLVVNPSMFGMGQIFYGLSAGGAVTLGGTQGGTTAGGVYRYGLVIAAFARGSGGLAFEAAPETVDEDDGTSVVVIDTAIGLASDVFWRADLGTALTIGELAAVIGFEDAGTVTLELQAGDASDWSDAATLVSVDVDATGSFTPDDVLLTFDNDTPYRYWQIVLGTPQSVEVFEVALLEVAEPPVPQPGKAILEIYVHDEDASRWGTATWATGPATGTEGIWSAAGWQDVTPEGVNAHVIWGSRQPSRGILAQQNAASWNVETFDPDRILDPGNFDSPFYPQLVPGVPVRISHDSLVIRTGYVDEWHYKHKNPFYQGQIIATDTWSLLNQASVPADSILGNTLLERIQDAINAAGIAVGGIPLPPSGPSGPAIADWEEGAATDAPTSVGDHIRNATNEVLWVPYVQADASLALRSWGDPLDRGREITAASLEDLESFSSEDGAYSVVTVQVEDPDLDPITRVAAPLPRYGRRVWERTEPTVDAEGYAAAILAERPWPGVQYIPGAIHCFSHADVAYFGSLEIMERVTVTVAGAVSVQGRILGGELFVEHKKDSLRGATWIFNFAIATDGATAIGLTTLVADGTGETLLDDATGTDYLEAD